MGSSSFSSSTPFFASFLETSTHLYKRLCPSVGPSVVPWVGPSVRGSVRNPLTKNAILARKLKESSTILQNSRKFKKILSFSHILDASLFVSNLFPNTILHVLVVTTH